MRDWYWEKRQGAEENRDDASNLIGVILAGNFLAKK